MMLWRASEVVLMSETSSKVSQDSVQIFGGIRGISGHSELMGGTSGDSGGGDGLCNNMGQLGLGACQFRLSEHFGFLTKGSLCDGGSLQLLELLDQGF